MSIFSDNEAQWTKDYKISMVKAVDPVSQATVAKAKNPEMQKLIFKWDICNKSQSHWDSCTLLLRHQNNPGGVELVIDPMYIKKGIKPSRIETLEVTVNMPIGLLSESIVLGFKFET